MIKTLSLLNFNRPGKREYRFGQLNIVTGQNGQGKSSVLDGIVLATAGKHPNYPATNKGIMENFGAGPHLGVSATASSGSVVRDWKQSGASVKATATATGSFEQAMTPALFNGPAFMEANNATRANMLRAAYPTTEDPRDSILAAVREIEGHVEPPEGWEDMAFDQFVEAYREACDAKKKELRATANRMKGTIAGIEQLDPGNIVESITQAQVNDATQAASDATSALSRLVLDHSKITFHPRHPAPARSLEELRKALEAAIRALDENNAKLRTLETDNKAKREAYELTVERNNALRRRRAQAVQVLDMARQQLAQNCIEEADVEAVEMGITKPTQAEFADSQAKVANHNRLSRLREQRKADVDRIEELAGAESCPHCGAKHDDWAEVIKEGLEARLKAAHEAYAEAFAAEQAASKLAEQVTADMEARSKGFAKAQAAAAFIQAKRELDNAPEVTSEPVPPEYATTESIEGRVYDIECDIQQLNDEIKAHEENADLDAKEARAAELLAQIKAGEAKVTEAVQLRDGLQKSFADANAYRANAAKQSQAQEELAEAEKGLDAATRTQEAISEAATKEAKKAVQPVLDIVQRFTQGILDVPVAANGLDFGRWHDAHWQPLAKLSGAEMAVVRAAFRVALATQSASRLVLVDELAVMVPEWKEQFMRNLEEAISDGTIEQAILLDHSPVKRPSWTIIEA